MLILSDKFIHKTVFLPSKPNVALISIAFRDNKTVDFRISSSRRYPNKKPFSSNEIASGLPFSVFSWLFAATANAKYALSPRVNESNKSCTYFFFFRFALLSSGYLNSFSHSVISGINNTVKHIANAEQQDVIHPIMRKDFWIMQVYPFFTLTGITIINMIRMISI